MKHMVKVKYLLVAAMLLLGSMNTATVQAVEFKGVFGAGLDFGGEVLASGLYSDGSSWDVKANEGLAINGGVVMVTGSFETQLTVGYKFGGPQAKNGSVTFDVMPVELMEFYRTSNLRMGLGVVSHNSPKLVISIPGNNSTTKFDNTVGTVVQIGWAPEKSPLSIDLRYTMAKFKQTGVANAKEFNGNVAGLYMSFFF